MHKIVQPEDVKSIFGLFLFIKYVSHSKGICSVIKFERKIKMEKFIYDEKNGLHYQLVGDYYLPCLKLNEHEQKIGTWGQRHFEYIKKYKSPFYTTLLMTDKLYDYLADVDKQAEEMYNTLIKQLAEKENVTEQLKAENQMEWVSKMNNIRQIIIEIVEEYIVCK